MNNKNTRRIRSFSLLIFTLFFSLSSVGVSALDGRFYSGNDILFYEPGPVCLGVSTGCGAEFDIATFNICYGAAAGGSGLAACARGVDYRTRLTKTVKTIKEYDLVLLQEVRENQYTAMMKKDALGENYDIYPEAYTRDYASQNPIVWNKDIFELVKGEKVTGSTVTGSPEQPKAITQVQLRFKASGQEIYAISTHEAVGDGPNDNEAAKRRTISAKNLKSRAADLTRGGTPVFIGGDFNSKMKASGVTQNAEDGDRNKLPYCILTDNTGLWSAFDAQDNRTGRCPTNQSSGVDFIYTNTSTTVSKYNGGTGVNTPGVGNNGSDHRTISARVKVAGNCGSSSQNLVGKDNGEKIYNYFLGKGLSNVQAAGIVGNMSTESGFDPERIQSKAIGEGSKNPNDAGSAGWGLIQWTPGSKVIGLAKDAKLKTPIYELATQLDLVWGHLNNKPPITTGKFSVEAFKNVKDVEEAVRYFETNIEGAGVKNYPDRYTAAKLALNQYDGQASTSSANSTTQSLDGCENDDGILGAEAGNAVKTALNYAWPEYHAPNYLEKREAYAKAITKAQGNGKYVGGGPNPGIDCGGFITRVMQDSGLDPEYGGGGNTDTQLAYLLSSGKYSELKNPTSNDLTPGAVAIKTVGGGHTYMYVGKQTGFETQIASSSYSPSNTQWRAPMAGHELPADPEYRWFVLK